jgi:glycosyltransferase involved in cell wall biosynthesis
VDPLDLGDLVGGASRRRWRIDRVGDTRMSGKKLLFVTYAFPPLKRIGCVRTWNIAKHLARSGWVVSVLTLDPLLWGDVESPQAVETALEAEGIRRLSTGHRWRWLTSGGVKRPHNGLSWFAGGIGRRAARYLGFDPSAGWVTPAERACTGLTADDVDVVLASGPPFSAFSLTRRLAERLRCPYVLDYRDLWSRHLHNPAPRADRKESAVVAGSAAVITVSPSWARVLDEQFGIGAKVHVVSNGYDPEDLAAVHAHPFGHFAIVYAGSLWPPTRVVSPVMAALRRLEETAARRSEPWMFHYFGAHGQHVLDEAQRFGVKERVIVHGAVPRATALEAVKGAGVAVVITSVETSGRLEDNGMVTGKIFEPIALGTPVLIIAPEGSDTNVVAETTGLGRRYAATDVDGIASFLDELMSGRALEPKDTAAYAWGNLVSTLDGILRGAIRA